MKRILLGVAITICAAAALGLGAPLGGGHVFPVTCAATATKIADATSTGMSALLLWNNSATAVYIGGSDVDTSTKGLPICTSASCFSASFPYDGGGLYCRVASGTTDITVVVGK